MKLKKTNVLSLLFVQSLSLKREQNPMGFKVVLATTEPIETTRFNCSAIWCEYKKPHSFVDILSVFGVSFSVSWTSLKLFLKSKKSNPGDKHL